MFSAVVANSAAAFIANGDEAHNETGRVTEVPRWSQAVAPGTPAKENHARTYLWKMQTIDRQDWSNRRRVLASLMETRPYELVLTIVLVVNMFVVVLETDTEAACKDGRDPYCHKNRAVDAANLALLIVYTLELFLKLYIYRTKFWIDLWNIFDVCIVATSLIAELLGGIFGTISAFRILRLARLGKLLRAMITFPALYMIVQGFLSAMVSIFWASFLLFFFLTLWSIVAVIILHPLTISLYEEYPDLFDGCERCPRAFESVMQADLTLLQTLIAGDSWGKLATPLIEHYPYTIVIFGLMLVTVSIGICNLILAVIVENAAAAREEDGIFQTRLKQVMEEKRSSELLRVCKAIDEDSSGTLSQEEVMKAYKDNDEFRAVCQTMRIDPADMDSLFKLADEDGSGDINYNELIRMLVKMKSMDLRTMLMFLKQDVLDVKKTLRTEVAELTKRVAGAVRQLEFTSEASGFLGVSKLEPDQVWQSGHDKDSAFSCCHESIVKQPSLSSQFGTDVARRTSVGKKNRLSAAGRLNWTAAECKRKCAEYGIWLPLPEPAKAKLKKSSEADVAKTRHQKIPEADALEQDCLEINCKQVQDTLDVDLGVLEEHNPPIELTKRKHCDEQEKQLCEILEHFRKEIKDWCATRIQLLQQPPGGVRARNINASKHCEQADRALKHCEPLGGFANRVPLE